MSLLLLFNGGAEQAVIIEELVATQPVGTHGNVIQRPATSGEWRFVLELADPTDPTPVWYDLTDFYVGDRHQFGADGYLEKARARLVTVQLQTDDDSLAPWGQDTTSLFGVDVLLGSGLLMRAGMIRVVSSTTVEWNPLWTGRVETWGDASGARGQVRTHIVNVVDTISDLANVPVEIPMNSDEWPDWYTDQLLPEANWLFGVDVYGDPTFSGLPLIDTPTAAIQLMDSGADTVGVVWRSLRTGRMVIHPAPWDTQHTERYANPLLDVYPGGLVFNYSPDFTDVEYIADDDQQPFGITRTIAGILNSFQVSAPGPDLYAVDDPVSIGRYGVRPYTATWLVGTHTPVDDLLTARAFAEPQALPLRTTLDHDGFWSAMAIVDHMDPITVIHATSDDGLVVTATGSVRNIVEERTVRGDGLLSWQTTIQFDLDATETSEPLLPVEDLAWLSSESPGSAGPSSAEFSWTNPTQPDITPTEVQFRIIGKSLIWNSTDYPGVGADGMTVGWLNAGTQYTLQVRLIRRVNGIVTNASAIREVDFPTPNRIFPVPIEGDDPTDTNVDQPPFEDCEDDDIELVLQENDGTGWVDVDDFSGTQIFQDDDGHWHLVNDIPNSFFNDDSMYRWVAFCGTELIATGPEFDPPDDWTDPCPEPPALSTTPYDDPSLLVYVPKICTGFEDADPDFLFQGMLIVEAVSGIAGVPGDALAEVGSLIGEPGAHNLVAIADPAWSDTPGGILAYGEAPTIIGHTGDATISIRGKFPEAETCVLGECGGMRLTMTPTSGGWRAGVTVYTTGTTVTLPTLSELDLDTTYTITAQFELATGDVTLFVDGLVDNSVGGSDNVPRINALPIWRVGAPPEGWVTDFALWNALVTPTPVGGALPVAILALNPLSYWKLRDNDLATLNDFGSLSLDMTQGGNPVTLDIAAGDDGFNYPRTTSSDTDDHMFAADSISYEPQNASGLTVMFFIKPSDSSSGIRDCICKMDSGGAGSWEIESQNSDGFIRARTRTSGAVAARSRFATALSTSGWSLVFIRFSGSATGFPAIRVDGVNQTGTTADSGTAQSNSTQTLKLFGHGGSSSHAQCALAHVAIFAGQLSDGDCATIESAAAIDGW